MSVVLPWRKKKSRVQYFVRVTCHTVPPLVCAFMPGAHIAHSSSALVSYFRMFCFVGRCTRYSSMLVIPSEEYTTSSPWANLTWSRPWGLEVSVLATGPNVCVFRPGRRRWIFKGPKIRGKTSFGGEVKLPVPCRKILRHVKEPNEYVKRYFVCKIHGHFYLRLSCSATRWLLVIAREPWWMNTE
jgi:hypothetical protein